MNASAATQYLTAVTVLSLTGCNLFGDPSVHYLGYTNEVADLDSPASFTISPRDAVEIINRSRPYPHIFADEFYHDDENYYVVSSMYIKSRNSRAAKGGTIINGQTGETFNRETETWETVPDRRVYLLEGDSDSSPDQLCPIE